MQNPGGPAFRTKRELALDTLREAIRAGRYAPGQALRQIQLMKDLGLGSTPVREAVLELLARGVLIQESHHSVRVAELDLDRLRNIYRVRALLETEAARVGTARISDAAIKSMRDLLQEMGRARKSGDMPAIARADSAFHRTLYAAAENPLLVDLVDQVGSSFPGNIIWNVKGRIEQSLKEHGEILSAVSRRDPMAAGFAVEKHLQSGLNALEAHIESFTKRSISSSSSKS